MVVWIRLNTVTLQQVVPNSFSKKYWIKGNVLCIYIFLALDLLITRFFIPVKFYLIVILFNEWSILIRVSNFIISNHPQIPNLISSLLKGIIICAWFSHGILSAALLFYDIFKICAQYLQKLYCWKKIHRFSVSQDTVFYFIWNQWSFKQFKEFIPCHVFFPIKVFVQTEGPSIFTAQLSTIFI